MGRNQPPNQFYIITAQQSALDHPGNKNFRSPLIPVQKALNRYFPTGNSEQLFLQSNPALILRPPAPIVGGDEEEI